MITNPGEAMSATTDPRMRVVELPLFDCQLSGHLRDHRDGRCIMDDRKPDNSSERYCDCASSSWRRIDAPLHEKERRP